MTIKERILHWVGLGEEDVLERPESRELSDEYVAKFRNRIDAKLPKSPSLKSVSRASW